MYTLALMLGKCVAALRGAFFGVFLNETRFFIEVKHMLREKKFILIQRFIYFGLLIIGIIIPIIIAFAAENSWLWVLWLMFAYIDTFILICSINSLLLNCKIYEYNGNEIIIYAGWVHHYIKVNGQITDIHDTLFTRIPIILSYALDDGTQLNVIITTMNRITLKINNKLFLETK